VKIRLHGPGLPDTIVEMPVPRRGELVMLWLGERRVVRPVTVVIYEAKTGEHDGLLRDRPVDGELVAVHVELGL
jgi:hypothetical protein